MITWLGRPGGAPHFQGQVSCESTGRTIAVVYDDESGDLTRKIAALPEILDALQGCASLLGEQHTTGCALRDRALRRAEAVLAECGGPLP